MNLETRDSRPETARRAVIFDMDGVLVDSEPIHKEADAAAFRTVGLEVPLRILMSYAGAGAELFFGEILARFGRVDDPETLRAAKNRILCALLEDRCPPVPGAIELVEQVSDWGWGRGLASSSDPEVVDLVLALLGLAGVFEVVATGRAVRRGKPAPDIFLRASELIGIPPRHCVVIEDTTNGVMAATAAGMPCIGFANPLTGDQDLSRAGHIVHGLGEIDAVLLESMVRE